MVRVLRVGLDLCWIGFGFEEDLLVLVGFLVCEGVDLDLEGLDERVLVFLEALGFGLAAILAICSVTCRSLFDRFVAIRYQIPKFLASNRQKVSPISVLRTTPRRRHPQAPIKAAASRPKSNDTLVPVY